MTRARATKIKRDGRPVKTMADVRRAAAKVEKLLKDVIRNVKPRQA